MLLRFHCVLFGLCGGGGTVSQEDAQLQRGSSVVVQIRVQLQDNLPQSEGEDNIHVNLIQYQHSLGICSTIFRDFPIFSIIFMYCFFEWQPKRLRAATQVCGHGARRNLSCQRHLRGASAGSSAKSFFYNSIRTFFGMC